MEKRKKKKGQTEPAGTEIAKRALNEVNVIFKQRAEHRSRHSGKRLRPALFYKSTWISPSFCNLHTGRAAPS